MVNPIVIANLKLGKKSAKIDSRTFKLEKLLTLDPPPASANWYQGVTSFGSMLNDTLGDCVCAAVGHAEQVATLNTTGELTPPDAVILNLYEKSCGYVPGNPATDQGGVIIDVLNWVRQHGVGVRKDDPQRLHKPTLYAFADPDPTNVTTIKQAIATFGIVDIGLQLPITAQNQVGSVWDVVGNPTTDPNSQPGSWGGHSVICSAYDADTITCITWGALQQMTWAFWTAYVDEVHALLMHAWITKFLGINLSAIEAELAALDN